MEGSGHGLIFVYPGFFLDRLRKTSKTFSQVSRSPRRCLNPGSAEYETPDPDGNQTPAVRPYSVTSLTEIS
jgi:hypothetical protein